MNFAVITNVVIKRVHCIIMVSCLHAYPDAQLYYLFKGLRNELHFPGFYLSVNNIVSRAK